MTNFNTSFSLAVLPKCEGCGSCCTGLEVDLTPEDIAAIPKKFQAISEDDGAVVMRQRKDESCSALDRKTGRCTIYAIRPDICRGFEQGNEDCLECLKRDKKI